MTNTYKTGNPIGSSAPQDLSDNASNLDEALNSPEPSFKDRFDARRQSWSGLEKLVQDAVANVGFEPTHLEYLPGTPLAVSRPTQLIDYLDQNYRVVSPAVFPVTLSGNWTTDQPQLMQVTDSSLRGELAGDSGATLVGRAGSTVDEDLTALETSQAALETSQAALETSQAALETSQAALETALNSKVSTSDKSLCTAWVNFNGVGTPAIRDSYNVASITRLGTGIYLVNFLTPFQNASYEYSVCSDASTGSFGYYADTATINSLRVQTKRTDNGLGVDNTVVTVAIHGGK